jgi:hypothetical protein
VTAEQVLVLVILVVLAVFVAVWLVSPPIRGGHS